MTGKVAKKLDKGFGFIKAEGMQKDVFFHAKSLVGITFDQLPEDATVTFEIEESPKGANAVNVQLA